MSPLFNTNTPQLGHLTSSPTPPLDATPSDASCSRVFTTSIGVTTSAVSVAPQLAATMRELSDSSSPPIATTPAVEVSETF